MWIKQDPRLLDDPRLLRLPDRAQLRFHQLYMLAGRCEAQGSFVMNGRQLTEEDIALQLRVKDDMRTFKGDLKALLGAELLTLNGRGYEITDWHHSQVDIDEIRRNNAKRQRDFRERHGNTGELVTGASRVSNANQSPEPEEDQSPEPEEDQPPTLPPSGSKRVRSGGRAGADPQAPAASPLTTMLDRMKPKERKRAAQIAPILTAVGLRQPMLNNITVLVATRISIGASELTPYVLAVLASTYADERAKNKPAVAAHRLAEGSLAPEFKDPDRWRSIPAEVLKAAGIDDLNEYIRRRRYG